MVRESIEDGRWIDVDLTTLIITAYEGETAVFQAPFSAGKPGYETPTGAFHVQYRVDHEIMDSLTLGVLRGEREGYYLEHVRYVQYFREGGYALHGNYWQPRWVFGRENTSHGCVGMLEEDAARFWQFATVGTPVVIRKSDPTLIQRGVDESSTDDEHAVELETSDEDVHQEAVPPTVEQEPTATDQVSEGGLEVSSFDQEPPDLPVRQAVRPPRDGKAWVPDVIGLPEVEARRLIEQAGLSTTYTNYQNESDVPEAVQQFFWETPPGSVLSSSPAPGAQVPVGTPVRLAVRKP